MRALVVTTLVAGLALSGCTTNPYTGQSQVSKGAIGGGAGALLGAAIGAATGGGHKGKAALIGAAAGGLLGGGVGVYMDAQEKKLREQMQGTGVAVERNQQTGAVDLIMPGAITFATARSDINPSFSGTLSQLAQTLSSYNQQTITVRGYTDNVGNASYNQQLSQERANSVANYLIRQGVAASRVQAVGYGMNNPVADNSTEAGRSQNRRVEISVNPPATVPGQG
ncbi:OmpA family protein [Aquirhabdus parva]|uniref:OmpA family protein n=1 Tax=Aquirhabdus parva TaxID=2283318 RepID=A0A345P4G7_9GAMM|nr:OmpA family protein [Aquirhabdus parva]AXI02176.1 OmpA family protein [Aquirhabdus parva]